MGSRAVAGSSSRKSAPKPEPDSAVVVLTAPPGDRIARELAALLMLVAAVFAALSLVSCYVLRRPTFCGPLGQILADNLAGELGYGSCLLLVFIVAAAVAVWSDAGWPPLVRIAAGGLIIVVSFSTLCAAAAGAAAARSSPWGAGSCAGSSGRCQAVSWPHPGARSEFENHRSQSGHSEFCHGLRPG